MRKVDYYKCPVCGMKYKTLGAWGNHLDTVHPGTITKGYSYARYFYYTLTGRTHGTCVQCKGDTEWSEATQKYNRYCNNPKCKQAYVKLAKSRMVGKHGVEHMLNDPDMQKKMLAGRKISGRYTFSDGSGSIPYVASYEKEFLMMLDKFMKFSASDIIAPSPNTYYYKYQDKMHFYIPDFFIPNLNLEIEVKQNTSTHPKILAVDKVKEQLKDDVMLSNPKINYIKVVDKDYTTFFDYLLKLRESMDDEITRKNTTPLPEFKSAMESFYDIDHEDEEPGYTSQDCLEKVSFEEACESINLHNYNRKDLSKFQKHPLNKDTFKKYAYKSRSLTDITWNDNLDGYIYTENEDEIVIGAIVVEKEESGIVFIKKIFLASGYDNLDLYPQMAKVAVKDFKATDIRISEKDYKKIDFFKTINFREYKKSGSLVYLSNKPDDRQAQMGKKLHPVYIYISSGNNPVAIGIKAATGDQWSHASIAFDTSLTRLYTMCPRVWNDNDTKSTVMGFNIENARKYLRQDYKGNRYALYVKFVNDNTYKAMQDKMHYFVQNKASLKYDWIGIAKMFVGMRTANTKGKYVCSNLVASILNADRNLTNGKPTDTIKPGDLQHIEDAFLVDFGFFRNYDQVEIDKRVAEIYERNYGSKKDDTSAKEQVVLEESMIEDFELQFLPDYIRNGNKRLEIAKEENPMNFKLIDTAACESELFFNSIFSDKDVNSVMIYDDAMESTVLKTNFNPVKVKGSMNLSEFTKIPITQEVLDKYKSQSASFDHVKLENSKGFLWVDKSDKIVGFVNVTDKKGIKWIQALNLQPSYQGYGLYEQLMKIAVKDLGGTDISTPPKNDTAKEVYQKFGFRTYNNHETVHAMTIRKDAVEEHRIDNATDKVKSDAVDNGKKNEADTTELKPVYIYLSYAKKGFGKFVKLMTNAPYSHASISFDSSLDHIYSFATRDGHTMIPIGFSEESKAQYMKLNPETTYALYVYFATPKSFDMMKAKVAEFQKNAASYRYDVPGVVKTFFGLPNANEKRFFCSEFVSLILNSGENKVTQKSADLMKPLDLPDVKDIRLVDMGHIKDYDKSFVDKRVEQLKKEAIRQIRTDTKTKVDTVEDIKKDNKEAVKK